MDQPAEQTPPKPEIPDFDLLRLVGEGGFGQVWLATNRTTGRLLAVKLIPLRQNDRSSAAMREISSLTRLETNSQCRHESLLGIHHIGKTADYLFYVMDPADDVSGDSASERPDYRPATLQSRLENGPIPPETCLDYARQLLAGLASLHSAGMVHRDVKPGNCLFVGGRLKLADFGLLTESHPLVSRVGTQKYMPPDGQMDRRADVYAAGLVMYEMLTGFADRSFSKSRPAVAGAERESLFRPIDGRCFGGIANASRPPASADARKMLAALEASSRTPFRLPRRRILTACIAIFLLATMAAAWHCLPRRVDVSFITVPYEAHVFLDGVLLVDPSGTPYATPCTIGGLVACTREVSFECKGQPRWKRRSSQPRRNAADRKPRHGLKKD